MSRLLSPVAGPEAGTGVVEGGPVATLTYDGRGYRRVPEHARLAWA